MHTISKDGDGTWYVGRMVHHAVGPVEKDVFEVMFKDMSLAGALRLVNCLNGGDVVMDETTIKIWGMCSG